MDKKNTNNTTSNQTLTNEEFNEKVQKLQKMFGLISITTPSESVIRTAEIKAQSGIPDSSPVCEQSKDRKAKLSRKVKEAGNTSIGLKILNDAYNEAVQRLAEISEVMCDCFAEIELTPREIEKMASEKFLSFVGTDYRLARASFVRSTSDAYGAVAINGRIEGPRFRTGSDKFASIRSEWRDSDGKPHFKEMSKEKEVSTKTRHSSGIKKDKSTTLECLVAVDKTKKLIEEKIIEGKIEEEKKQEFFDLIQETATEGGWKKVMELHDYLISRIK